MRNSYDKALNEARDLTAESRSFRPAQFRDDLAAKVVQALARRRSVLVVGPSGVGKTCVIHEVAARFRQSGRAKIFELSVPQLLTGTKYLGEWETKAARIIESAAAAGAVLYFSDIWNLPTAAKSSNRDVTAWDFIRPYVEQGKLQLIGEITPEQLLELGKAPGFATLFEPIVVPPLSTEQVEAIAAAEAKRMGLDASTATIARLLELVRQFMAASESPRPALELLAQVRDYQVQKRDVNEPEDLSPTFVEKVFSIYSGLPLIVVSPSVTKPVTEIKAWFEERIIGQKDAIRSIVETIALYKSGLHDPGRPIGTFLFVGPTGVGKTELARALAKFLFGSENRLLRFDLSEYKDYHAFQLLIGDPGKPGQPARLVDPVRARPFQVVLLDEFEKAHQNVWDLLLQLLDEGRLTPAAGKTVSFRNTIVIATSNVGAQEQARAALGFLAEQGAADERVRSALEAHFRPELLNRFQHVVHFHPLTEEHVRQIARMEIARVLARQGIAGRDIAVDMTPAVLDLIVAHGYDKRYGARALRRVVQRHVAVPIATLLLERQVEDGAILRLVVGDETVWVEVVETPEARARKAETRPIKTRFGQVSSRADIEELLRELSPVREALVREVKGTAAVADEQKPYAEAQRQTPEMLARWARRREAELAQERRLEKLALDELELFRWLEQAATRGERQRLLRAIASFDEELQAARRELTVLPAGSIADAIIELVTLGARNDHALELFRVYASWAKRRGYSVDLVCEPLTPSEPIVAAIGGHYAYGYLHLEAGHHRFRDGHGGSVVRVRVLPWLDRSEDVMLTAQRALKKAGLLGGRVRSRAQVTGLELLVQNERTLVENLTFAASVAPSFRNRPDRAEVEVRRYDAKPFLLKDHLLGATGKASALAPDRFHDVLCERVESTYASATSGAFRP